MHTVPFEEKKRWYGSVSGPKSNSDYKSYVSGSQPVLEAERSVEGIIRPKSRAGAAAPARNAEII
jgi:hypothetical protein